VKHLLISLICVILIAIFATQGISLNAQADDPIPTSEIIIDAAGICPEYPGGLAAPSPTVNEEDIALMQESVVSAPNVADGGSGFVMYPENFRQIYGLYVYGVEPETPVTVHYNVNYYGFHAENNEDGVPARYFALLNEEFIPLGEEGVLHRDLILPPGEDFTIPIQLPALAPGLHDLVVIGIAEPDSEPLFLASIREGDMNLLSFRITIVAGDPSQLSENDPRAYTLLSEGLPELELADDRSFLPVWFVVGRRTDPWTMREAAPTLKLPPNAEVTYAIHLAYSAYATKYGPDYEGEPFAFANPDSTRFALILFEGANPIPIVGDDLVFYGEVPRDIPFGRLEMKTTVPEAGIRNLVAVRIDNPGQSLCKYIDPWLFGIHAYKVTIEADTGE
jgi:hypothetical protein